MTETTARIVRVFLASPGDVPEERAQAGRPARAALHQGCGGGSRLWLGKTQPPARQCPLRSARTAITSLI